MRITLFSTSLRKFRSNEGTRSSTNDVKMAGKGQSEEEGRAEEVRKDSHAIFKEAE